MILKRASDIAEALHGSPRNPSHTNSHRIMGVNSFNGQLTANTEVSQDVERGMQYVCM